MTEYFECQCTSPEHTISFTDDDNEITISYFLNQYHSIFARIWVAIKYVFGYKCQYGHFDVTILKTEDIPRLIRLLEKVK
jgi:hypothetical protein